ncbi:MAG TPA: glycosyltransferase family 2 protein [Tepidisphaeraceae bacterium]|jgi:hypothetical protein|nr:glycosyltransferase family 2 protein [Tepidisphaeraceae bacterium]
MLLVLAIVGLLLSILSAGLFFDNLRQFRTAPQPNAAAGVGSEGVVSVLIPARNEEASIGDCVRAVLANDAGDGRELEVIVLDDGSTDRTADIVRDIAAGDARLRLEAAPPLPVGWCGKQHACHVLSMRARGQWLAFIDADVRLSPDAVRRAIAFAVAADAPLVSGFPRQQTGTMLERMLIPLIHFVLLGFLPIRRMRMSTSPAYGAGCGQFFIARRDAYDRAGGHAAIRASLHDGVTLPRAFRNAGDRTDLFDATDTATCRMYQSNGETWHGLAKNATEGMAAPAAIVPWTIMLTLGQVLPMIWFAYAALAPAIPYRMVVLICAGIAVLLSYAVRLAGAARFRQSRLGAMLHPVSIVVLLAIQWYALSRRVMGRSSTWRGRSYGAAVAGVK